MNEDYESFERAERRRYADKQHQREVRAVSFTIVIVALIGLFALSLIAKACNASWQRDAEMQRYCIEKNGSWVETDNDGPSHWSCQFK